MVKHRVERVSDRIQEEVSDLLLKQIRDPRIEFVTVTGVKVGHRQGDFPLWDL